MQRASDRYEIRFVAPAPDQPSWGWIGVVLDLLIGWCGSEKYGNEYLAVFERGGDEIARFSCHGDVGCGAFYDKLTNDLTQLSEDEFLRQWGIERGAANA